MKPSISPPVQPGANHTGAGLHPEYVETMLRGTAEFGPTSSGGAELYAKQRMLVAKLSTPVATMPLSPDLDAHTLLLLDKLGARLQFERTGTRLYDALLSKLDAYGAFEGGPVRADLEAIRNDEHQHFLLVHEVIGKLGGDPTVVTPCANLRATASRGICDVLVDPRTNLIECLDAILVAELADRESWEQLVTAFGELPGQQDAVTRVKAALDEEEEHLAKVRAWIAAAGDRHPKAS